MHPNGSPITVKHMEVLIRRCHYDEHLSPKVHAINLVKLLLTLVDVLEEFSGTDSIIGQDFIHSTGCKIVIDDHCSVVSIE